MKKTGTVRAVVVKNLWAAMAENCRWIGGSIAESVRMLPRVAGNFVRSVWGVVHDRDVAIGFGTAVAMWAVGYVCRLPPAPAPSSPAGSGSSARSSAVKDWRIMTTW